MRFHAQADVVDLGESVDELVTRDGLAVDLDALGRFDQVRRRVESGAKAGGTSGGFDHGAGGSFAVGAGDVDCAQTVLGVAQSSERFGDVLKAEFGGFDFVAEGVEVLY